MDLDPDPRAAQSAVRLGDLRRRRIDPRAHARDRRADPRRNLADAGGAPDLRRRDRARRSMPSPGIIGSSGVRNIVALRGDPSEPGTQYQPHAGRLSRRDRAGRRPQGASRRSTFRSPLIPKSTPNSSSREFDLENLKRKVDAGADRAITQFFFSSDCFFRFRDEAAAAGIDAEIVPGILPVSNVATTRRFAQACGATIPRLARSAVRGPRRLAGGAPADRGDGRRRAVPASFMPAASATSISTRSTGPSSATRSAILLGVRAKA